jgi:hypothetical protein
MSNIEEPTTKTSILEPELIMSIAIIGHGCEDYTKPLSNPDYFRNNVRVYSRSCVPGVVSVGNVYQNQPIIQDIRNQFARLPDSETMSIVEGYARTSKPDYKKIVDTLEFNAEMFDRVFFDKSREHIDRSSDLSTFLFDKSFGFYKSYPTEKDVDPRLLQTIGIHVVDIREKITEPDGSVHYRQIFNPTDSKYERIDMSNFNLIYKDGLTYILKTILKIKKIDIFKSNLGFTGRTTRILDLSLEQLYDFFQLLDVKYVNIMDFSCRSCAVPMDESVLENFYRIEQENVKTQRTNPSRFGGSKKRRNRGHRKTKRKYLKVSTFK